MFDYSSVVVDPTTDVNIDIFNQMVLNDLSNEQMRLVSLEPPLAFALMDNNGGSNADSPSPNTSEKALYFAKNETTGVTLNIDNVINSPLSVEVTVDRAGIYRLYVVALMSSGSGDCVPSFQITDIDTNIVQEVGGFITSGTQSGTSSHFYTPSVLFVDRWLYGGKTYQFTVTTGLLGTNSDIAYINGYKFPAVISYFWIQGFNGTGQQIEVPNLTIPSFGIDIPNFEIPNFDISIPDFDFPDFEIPDFDFGDIGGVDLPDFDSGDPFEDFAPFVLPTSYLKIDGINTVGWPAAFAHISDFDLQEFDNTSPDPADWYEIQPLLVPEGSDMELTAYFAPDHALSSVMQTVWSIAGSYGDYFIQDVGISIQDRFIWAGLSYGATAKSTARASHLESGMPIHIKVQASAPVYIDRGNTYQDYYTNVVFLTSRNGTHWVQVGEAVEVKTNNNPNTHFPGYGYTPTPSNGEPGSFYVNRSIWAIGCYEPYAGNPLVSFLTKNQVMPGRYYNIGITGVVEVDLTSSSAGDTSFTDSAGNTWTLNDTTVAASTIPPNGDALYFTLPVNLDPTRCYFVEE